MAVGGRISVNQAAIDTLVSSPAGPVARLVVAVLQDVTQEAKRLAPVGEDSRSPQGHPAGYLRSEIGWSMTGGKGIGGVVQSPALTSSANPYPGEPYGLHIERPETRPRPAPDFAAGAQPYLVPALIAVCARRGLPAPRIR